MDILTGEAELANERHRDLDIWKMQGGCTYSSELKTDLIGLTAGIRRFKASLRSAWADSGASSGRGCW